MNPLAEALRDVLDEYDRNTCLHQETHRAGVQWTICDGCGMKWADDEGGPKPRVDPPKIAAARGILAAEMMFTPVELAKGCLAACAPCEHQQSSPTTICKTCQAAAPLLDPESEAAFKTYEGRLDAIAPPDVAAQIAGANSRHQWGQRFNLTCCTRCGIVRRADGGNDEKACRGFVRVDLRGVFMDPAPDQAPEEIVAAYDNVADALTFVDSLADRWMVEHRWVDSIKAISSVGRLNRSAPDDVREKFIARQESLIDALVRQAFLEGWLAGDENGKAVARIKGAEKIAAAPATGPQS